MVPTDYSIENKNSSRTSETVPSMTFSASSLAAPLGFLLFVHLSQLKGQQIYPEANFGTW